MLTVLGGLAEFERDLIRAAAAAKATGVKARGVKCLSLNRVSCIVLTMIVHGSS